ARLLGHSLRRPVHLGRDGRDADDPRSHASRVTATAPTALVLSGGGARAAYQAGVLRAVAGILGKGRARPFPIICGTSAGAIHDAALATEADDFRRGVAQLVRWWRRIGVADVYHGDLGTLSRHGMRFLAAMT